MQMTGVPSISIDERCGEFYNERLSRWFFFTCYSYGKDGIQGQQGEVITIHDTTEVKQAAMEIEKAYDELKDAQAQMIQQEKLASIGQIAAGVVHEINNPTGYVISNLGTLGKYLERFFTYMNAQAEILDHLGTPETQKLSALRKQLKIDHLLSDTPCLIAESLDGAGRIKKIVQDMKKFSRMDEAERVMTDLSDCIDSTVNIVWNELKYKVTLKKEYSELPPIMCCPQQLSQVFMNLLVNAGHAIEAQGEITIKTRRDGDSAHVDIADTGCGMTDDIRSRIFEPFFTTKEVGKGTGLGLPISYDIIKKHGGDITVDSVVGKGTTFTVRLPLNGTQALELSLIHI
jgi:two-component system NtrC family sensor kinase